MRAALLYAIGCAIVLLVVGVFDLDRDEGGYRDTWATFDKQAHCLAGAVLVFGAFLAGVPVWPAVLITIAAAWAWELVQSRPQWVTVTYPDELGTVLRKSSGFFSWRDGVASTAGAILGGLWILLTT